MNNFSRIIDTRSFLPPILREVREMKILCEAEDAVIGAEWEAVDTALDDQFIDTADESGITRREHMLGIVPFASDTLDDRRLRLLARYSESPPYTRQTLAAMLDSICGTGGYELLFDASERSVSVRLALSAKKQLSSVAELLERILPLNMAFTVEPKYNSYSKLKALKWSAAKEKSWYELKEEEIT